MTIPEDSKEGVIDRLIRCCRDPSRGNANRVRQFTRQWEDFMPFAQSVVNKAGLDASIAGEAVNHAVSKILSLFDRGKLKVMRSGEQLNYLRAIIRNYVTDEVRQQGKAVRFGLDALQQLLDRPTVSRDQDYETLKQNLTKYFGWLPAELRTPLEMRIYEGFAWRDIATELGVPESTVRGRVTKALMTLREYIEEHCPAAKHLITQ